MPRPCSPSNRLRARGWHSGNMPTAWAVEWDTLKSELPWKPLFSMLNLTEYHISCKQLCFWTKYVFKIHFTAMHHTWQAVAAVPCLHMAQTINTWKMRAVVLVIVNAWSLKSEFAIFIDFAMSLHYIQILPNYFIIIHFLSLKIFSSN